MKHGYFSFLVAGLLAGLSSAQAQTTPGGVRIGTAGTPNPAAILDIDAQGKGLLIPRMDSVTRVGIATPPDGLMVFQTDGRQGFWYAAGGSWLFIPDKARAADNLGNHVLSQNLVLNGKRLVGGTAATPGTAGLTISNVGLVRLNGQRLTDNYENGTGMILDNADAGFVVRTNVGYGSTTAPTTGAGDRMMWSSFYGAFRAGGIDGAQWDGSNLGFYSAAFGYNNSVGGNYSLASGYNNTVRGSYSTAIGASNTIDQNSTASVVFGNLCRVKSSYSLVSGINSLARGRAAVALGERCTANAANAVALGRFASAAGRSGTFTIADASVNDSLRATVNNQFSARYSGGYRLYSNAAMSIGVVLNAGSNSWQVTSDSTKKELVRVADGNEFLARINQMRLGSWNYRGQDPRTMRHYGPMAQDFYQAFGHDALGVIGNDTTINQADFDGVNLIAIQALYRQVLALKADNAHLRQQVQQLQTTAATGTSSATATAALEERLRRLEALLGPQAQR
ncbi:tail fiber domain-containing protein [Hymenobacter sp. DG01]|uniref:tail fiber domain-containing protein n=1 Tax=Hymenobacter sp. DG01 TaxID=2584940 RepID=UPI0011232D8C|nr:tail fiber domain-containing protein [Hymenobacter sp. DG01]